MTLSKVDLKPGALELRLDDQHLRLPYLWLRDNEPAAFHPLTRERSFDLLTVPEDLTPDSAEANAEELIVHWPDLDAPRAYALDWLRSHAPGQTRPDPATVTPEPWANEAEPPRFDAAALRAPVALLEMLKALKRHGLVIVAGLTGDNDGVDFGRLIGFMRESNFGTIFDVVSMPDPNNQAYTADFLDLHTDLPNQQLVPGYQFLHCIRNQATGGDSLFCDGFAVLEDFRTTDAEDWQILRDVQVPYRFRDETTDLRQRRAIIECDAHGRPVRMAFNPGILDVVDLPGDLVERWYAAWYRLRYALKAHPARITCRLETGEMAVFDNSRILHGRTAFDPSSGERRLRGYYIDRGEVDSRMRLICGAHTD